MKRNFITNFILCGCIGWCFECLWTGIGSICEHKDPKLHCTTSVWMFPIYGMAAIICPVHRVIKSVNSIVRGGIYAFSILGVEFLTGKWLKQHGRCPWDYSNAKYNYKGVIRLDYLPVWFVVGLIYEKVLCEKDCYSHDRRTGSN